MARKAQEEMSSRMESLKNLPVTLSFSGGSLSVALAPEYAEKAKAGQVEYEQLLKVYEASAALDENPQNVESKEALRDAILAAAPESEKPRLATFFAVHEVYDSWTSLSSEEQLLRTRQKLSEYIKAGADKETLRAIESSLPSEKVELFNSTMDAIRKKGFEKLSDPNLFMSDSKAIFDTATDGVKSVLDDVQKLVPSIR